MYKPEKYGWLRYIANASERGFLYGYDGII